MPKYYVESGRARRVLSAACPLEAAVRLFQWSCDRQAEIDADSPLHRIQLAEVQGCLLGDEVRVGETGFGGMSAALFETQDVVCVWQSRSLAMTETV